MTRPKALIADADSTRADLLAETVRQAGFDSVVVHTGRDALKRLSAASDIDVVWVDHEIPYPQLPYFLSQVRADYRYGRLPVMVTLSSNPELGRLPELDVRLGRLTSAVAGVKVVDKTPLRIELAYDALATDVAAIETWLKSVTHDHPKLKVTTDSVLYVRIDTVAYKEPTNEMIQQLREMTIDLFEIKVVQESPTRTLLGISSDRQAPAELEARMQRFVRDYKETRVTREVATRVVITSGVSMAVPIDVERRVLAQAQPHRNTQVVNRPVTPEAVVSGLLAVADTAGRPLSPAERKDSQIRAIDALRKMATGVISGYDVRPAASEIRAAMLNDELAPAAIEATGRMSGTDSQNALAAVALNEKRPGPIRVLAAGELVRHIQAHGSGAINDAMLKQLIRAAESDPNADLKMAMQLVVGAFSNDRVLANLPNDDARAKWVNRVIRYVPAAPGGAALAPAPAPAEKKDEGN
jgi:CheY-like chemotaxis protein